MLLQPVGNACSLHGTLQRGAAEPKLRSSPSPAYRVPAVRRAFEILFLLKQTPQGMGVSEIARALGIGKGPCYAILKTLEALEVLVCENAGKRYRLGSAVVQLGNAVAGRQRYVEVARPWMERLAAVSGLGCFLSAPYGSDEFVIVAKAESAGKVKITLDVGEHFHALGGAHGKALLAWQPATVVDQAIRRLALPRYTPRSITDAAAFRRALDRTRRNGFAESYGEYMLGVNSAAAPVFNGTGDVVLILKIIGSANQLPPRRMRELGRRVRRAAELLSAELEGRYPEATSPAR